MLTGRKALNSVLGYHFLQAFTTLYTLISQLAYAPENMLPVEIFHYLKSIFDIAL